jgi:methylated-DNA--[protein]-cysteine S-methyltransferase
LQNLYFLPSFGHEISDKTMKDYKVDKASLSETFCQEVYQVVCEIPLGKVSTYGSIAALLGMPQCSRMVGRALKQVPDNVSTPCHRVVNASGRLVPGWEEQKQILLEEGVSFKQNGCVDLKKHLWNYSVSE